MDARQKSKLRKRKQIETDESEKRKKMRREVKVREKTIGRKEDRQRGKCKGEEEGEKGYVGEKDRLTSRLRHAGHRTA